MKTLILSAGSIASKYQAYTFLHSSPALVPIATRSAISSILDFYAAFENEVYIATNAEDIPALQDELLYYQHLNFIPIRGSQGVCDSLQQSLAAIETADDLIVNIVTTIPVALVAANTAMLASEADLSKDFSGVVPGDAKPHFHFKGDEVKHPYHAFTGLFRSSKAHIEEALRNVRHQNDLFEVVEALHRRNGLRFIQDNWIDIGHEINYASARKKMISSRSFNSIQVDAQSGILKKKSRHIEKLKNETRYVSMLPAELQILYPRILGAGATDSGEVEMEYYGYPNLAEYQLYRQVPEMHWVRIFKGLEHILRRMSAYKFSIGRKTFTDFYFGKTASRIQDFKNDLGSCDALFRDGIRINGIECRAFEALEDALRERVDAMYDEGAFAIMHGDYCFNNILYDIFSGTLKLIDPRGSFGEACIGIYGDAKYDVAKLLHSSVGHYDYIVNNLFRLQQPAEGVFEYQFPLRGNQEILNTLSARLVADLGLPMSDIMLQIGLLFLSMCALHSDNRQRQKVMYLHGLQYVNQYLSGTAAK